MLICYHVHMLIFYCVHVRIHAISTFFDIVYTCVHTISLRYLLLCTQAYILLCTRVYIRYLYVIRYYVNVCIYKTCKSFASMYACLDSLPLRYTLFATISYVHMFTYIRCFCVLPCSLLLDTYFAASTLFATIPYVRMRIFAAHTLFATISYVLMFTYIRCFCVLPCSLLLDTYFAASTLFATISYVRMRIFAAHTLFHMYACLRIFVAPAFYAVCYYSLCTSEYICWLVIPASLDLYACACKSLFPRS